MGHPPREPLAWLLEHYRADLPLTGGPVTWPGPELEVQLMAEVPALPHMRQSPPYLIRRSLSPRSPPLSDDPPLPTGRGRHPGRHMRPLRPPGTGISPRLRGEIIHRGLETLGQGRELPGVAGLGAALRQEGLERKRRPLWPRSFGKSWRPAAATPGLAARLNPELPGAVSEWLIEDLAAPETLRRGKIDRLSSTARAGDSGLQNSRPERRRIGRNSSPTKPRSTGPSSRPTGR